MTLVYNLLSNQLMVMIKYMKLKSERVDMQSGGTSSICQYQLCAVS